MMSVVVICGLALAVWLSCRAVLRWADVREHLLLWGPDADRRHRAGRDHAYLNQGPPDSMAG